MSLRPRAQLSPAQGTLQRRTRTQLLIALKFLICVNEFTAKSCSLNMRRQHDVDVNDCVVSTRRQHTVDVNNCVVSTRSQHTVDVNDCVVSTRRQHTVDVNDCVVSTRRQHSVDVNDCVVVNNTSPDEAASAMSRHSEPGQPSLMRLPQP